jgi:hypothetical protein
MIFLLTKIQGPGAKCDAEIEAFEVLLEPEIMNPTLDGLSFGDSMGACLGRIDVSTPTRKEISELRCDEFNSR